MAKPLRFFIAWPKVLGARIRSPRLTSLLCGDDHVFGVAIVDALIEVTMGNEWLESCALEGFEGFFET